jgi:hypothetical protein
MLRVSQITPLDGTIIIDYLGPCTLIIAVIILSVIIRTPPWQPIVIIHTICIWRRGSPE